MCRSEICAIRTGFADINQFSGGNRRTASGAIKSPIRSPARALIVFGASTVRYLSDAPLTTIRCLSPIKLMLSMVPESGALADSTIRIVEQQDARTNRYRARQRNPLTLTAGELIDATVLQPRNIGQ